MIAVRAVLMLGLCASAHADDKKPEAPKTFEMRFKAAKWDDVLEWYARETGLTMITTVRPRGTFTFEPPKPNQRYTVAEITDILNEALVPQKYLLVRRTMTFFLYPADEMIEPRFVPRVTLDELKDRGASEIVQVVLKVPAALEDEAKELWKSLTPFGSLVRVKDTVIVTDTAKSVRRIKVMLTEVERSPNIEGFKKACPPFHPHAGPLRGGFTRLRD